MFGLDDLIVEREIHEENGGIKTFLICKKIDKKIKTNNPLTENIKKIIISAKKYDKHSEYKKITNNFKKYPLTEEIFYSRNTFSRYIYNLHEIINKMLGKTSNLTYCQVRDRYENFRSRCVVEKPKFFNFNKKNKEKGCTKPLYGNKAKCVLSFVPATTKCKTIKIDKKCLKKKIYIN
jgi:hypothetical protein